MKNRASAIVVGVLLAGVALWGLRPGSSRAAYLPGRFTSDTQIATDSVTGLMWQVGFGAPVYGDGAGATQTAELYCSTLALGGFHDWRLPSAKELMSLWDPYAVGARIDNGVFTPSPYAFYSSSFVPQQPPYVYVVNFSGIGSMGASQTGNLGAARCVRSPGFDAGF
jgi:hypothetical protein